MSQISPELAKAFVKAQGAMGKLIKDSTNPHLKNKYASLAAVIDAIRQPLADNGLALYQSATTSIDEKGNPIAVVRSLLMHESGEYIEDELPMPIEKNNAQGIGSAITYGRRYAAMAICGLAPDDEDDDGNAASGTTSSTQRSGKHPQPQRQPQNNVTKADSPAEAKDAATRAREAFHASGVELFGDLWDTARPLVVERYTGSKTPDKVRKSSNDLAPGELSEIAGTFKTAGKGWQTWIHETMAAKEPTAA